MLLCTNTPSCVGYKRLHTKIKAELLKYDVFSERDSWVYCTKKEGIKRNYLYGTLIHTMQIKVLYIKLYKNI